MGIGRLMAVEAAPGRLAEFRRLRMTAAALRRFVPIAQFEIRKGVIESLAIELDNIGVSPLVIGMTVGAVLLGRIRLPPVKSFMRQPIRGNFFVARQAEACLRLSRKGLVAIATVLFEFGVSADERTRVDQLLKKVLRTRDRCNSR
jgi:hypothetical protein